MIGGLKGLNYVEDSHLEGISWDIHWMTNFVLVVIIRDYLRFFIRKTPEAVRSNPGTVFEEAHETGKTGSFDKRQHKGSMVAEEFDKLMHDMCKPADGKEIDAQAMKAFTDLSEIWSGENNCFFIAVYPKND